MPGLRSLGRSTLVLGGAAVGGAIGYYAFFWIAHQGFYALAVPGGLLGVGAGVGKNRSKIVAFICGAAALELGLLVEWQFSPFIKDASWTYFFFHLHQLKPVTWLMLIIGTAVAFWIPYQQARHSVVWRSLDYRGRR